MEHRATRRAMRERWRIRLARDHSCVGFGMMTTRRRLSERELFSPPPTRPCALRGGVGGGGVSASHTANESAEAPPTPDPSPPSAFANRLRPKADFGRSRAASADGWEGGRVYPARHCEEHLRRPAVALASYGGLGVRRSALRVGGSNPESRCGEILDCFAFARNDVARVYVLATPRARGLQEILSRLQKKEGAGNAGCSMHPQPRVQIKKDARVLTRFTGITPAFPAQWC